MQQLNKGDILIDRRTLKRYPIIESEGGHVWLELNNRLVKRSMGQMTKYHRFFTVIRVGQKLDKDYAFYCPVTNRMIVLKAGTVFLGEV